MLAFAAPLFAPQVLAFPYYAEYRGSRVWSERPLSAPALHAVLDRAASLVAASPLARPGEPRNIFLTRGGWRWTWLALQSRRAFALTRSYNEAVIIGRHDVASDRGWNGASIGGTRTLSGLIAHETCHGLERRRFGWWVDITKPAWLREGYCDYVARESALSAAEIAKLKATGRRRAATVYYEGHKRVSAELTRNGGDVEALFAAH